MNPIIINADDFGLKSSVNKAIVDLFNEGIITSTTLMANMPGFDEAIELAHNNNIISKIGIHLTLTEGNPITSDILNMSLFLNEAKGDLKRHKKSLFFLGSDRKKLVFNEFSAQIEKLLRAGIKITHIDTHHHIDEAWSITQIIIILLKKYNIPSMRIMNNLNLSTNAHKKAYRKFVNNYIRQKGMNYSDFLGNQFEASKLFKNDRFLYENKKLEIMVHPDYNNAGIIIDKIKDQEYSFEYPEKIMKLIS